MKVLIHGLGSIAQKHVLVLKKLNPEVKIYALRSGESKHPIDGVISIHKLEELKEEVDFVIISTPTSLHYQSIMMLKSLKVPLFIEKPVLISMDGANLLGDELEKAGVKTYVACNLRFHPVIQFLKQELKRKKPLELLVYCGSYLPEWRPGTDYTNSYSSKKEMGGGVELDLIHEVDYTIYLLGHPNKRILSYGSRLSNLEISSNDFALYVLEYENLIATITLNYYRKKAKRTIEIIWDDDIWYADLLQGKVLSEFNGIIFKSDYNIMKTYSAQMSHFIDNYKSDYEFENNFRESLKILNLAI